MKVKRDLMAVLIKITNLLFDLAYGSITPGGLDLLKLDCFYKDNQSCPRAVKNLFQEPSRLLDQLLQRAFAIAVDFVINGKNALDHDVTRVAEGREAVRLAARTRRILSRSPGASSG